MSGRHKMKLELAEQALNGTWPCRPISPADTVTLGTLMVEAYRGAIDYEGETVEEAIEEVRGMLATKYGSFMASSSFLVEMEGQPVAACIVTFWEEAPLVTVIMTHPNYRGQGMGTFLLQKSINALYDQGYEELYLFVTIGNEDAQHIYEKLGFVVVEEIRKSG